MIQKNRMHYILPKILWIIAGLTLVTQLSAQVATDTLRGKNLYNPERLSQKDTIDIPPSPVLPAILSGDSLATRLKFILDSIDAREKFISDSLIRRQRILDSLNFLQDELSGLLEAYLRTVKEEIIIENSGIEIVGDSMLGHYSYRILPFNLTQPYTPWKVALNLSDKRIAITVDNVQHKILSCKAPFMNCSFVYGKSNNILIINELSNIQNDRWGQFYKTPVDSVFFDRLGRVVKIKRYIQFYQLINSNQRGAHLFLNLSQVKQYEYGPGNQIASYQLVTFCDRWKQYEASKVCTIINYSFTLQNKTYTLNRQNDPANSYSDGSYTFEFDSRDNLKGIWFKNNAGTVNWERLVELNEQGFVSCYIDKSKGYITQSLCMNYFPDDPDAKYPVEIINTVFEDDGISYLQRNNTAGKSRVRDRMTLEWSPWE
jgi:hypothetical protein